MERAANDNWPKRQLVVVRHAGQGDSLWSDIPSKTQDRIRVTLGAIYADLLQQPLSTRMVKLIRQSDTRLETSCHAVWGPEVRILSGALLFSIT
jgi:hypothetical protein